jgi:hypothetical protein
LPTTEAYQEALEKFEEFVKFLTEHVPVWAEAAEVPPGIQHAKLKQIRARGYVCLTATGLNIIGRVGHELLSSGAADWKDYALKLAQLDWLKTNPLWADVVQPKKDKMGSVVYEEIQVNGHIEKRPIMQLVTNRAPLNRAIYKVFQVIGLAAAPPAEAAEESMATTDEPSEAETIG